MTLAAGFKAADGILLCADTLVSDGYTKQYRGKIWTWQAPLPNPTISVAFAVAGDATIGVMAAENCCIELDLLKWDQRSFSDVYKSIAATVRFVHQEYVDKAPIEDRERSRFWMLIAIYTENSGHRLYVTNNAAVSPVNELECIGSGRSIGIYVLEPSYKNTMSIEGISTLALHAFAAAKERCDGVGGSVHFLALRKHTLSPVGDFNIEGKERDVLTFRQQCAELLSDIGNTAIGENIFAQRLLAFNERVKWLRVNWTNPTGVFAYLAQWLSTQEVQSGPQSPTADPRPPQPSPESPAKSGES
jgi:Proteasome subunit